MAKGAAVAQSVEQQVRQIVVEQMGADEEEVTATASLVDDLGCDSLDLVELVMGVEESFDIEIPDEHAEKFKTVANVVDYVNAHRISK